MSVSEASPHCDLSDTGPVKHTAPLISFLERLQSAALDSFGGDSGFDPKLYVDLPLKFDLSITEDAFDKLPRTENGSIPVQDLQLFIETYMDSAESDLLYVEPVDFMAEPDGFLPKVENQEVRKWALEVHSLWKKLSRKVADRVREQPQLHTLLPLPEPFMIPGSRFREVYYWDSYWVIRGLLASKMYTTAKSIVLNLLYLLDEYGYVINGARSYYTNRSQPPLLSSMVLEIYMRTNDLGLLRRALPSLLKEHHFWNTGIHKVTIQDAQACNHTLSRYYAMWNKTRPECSTIDKESASKFLHDSEKQQLYRQLATAAESGWDFSTRWMRNTSDLTSLVPTSIIPVDLNAYIIKMELDIALMARTIGENQTAEHFLEASRARKKAIESIFWNDEMGQWLDYWLINNHTSEDVSGWEAQNQNQNIFASNFIPIWIEPFNSDDATVASVLKSLQSSGLLCTAGIATSLTNSGQQWDFPNGWPPLQHMIVEGLGRSGSKEAWSVAEDIAVRWIRTNYAAYRKTGKMNEKYDVEACGEIGGGGEYIPQAGFGWTNGVLLTLLEHFGWPQELKIDC